MIKRVILLLILVYQLAAHLLTQFVDWPETIFSHGWSRKDCYLIETILIIITLASTT